jgi:hypothetical protein
MRGSGRSTMMVSYAVMRQLSRVLAILTISSNDKQELSAAK